MEEIDLLELLKKWCKVLYKNKWWILGITTLVAVLSFVFTLPGINKPLKEVKLTMLMIGFPKNMGITQREFANNYFSSSEFKKDILRVYGENVDLETKFSIKNFDKRVQITASRTDISFVVRHESAEKALQIINTATNLLDKEIRTFISVYLKSELLISDSLIKLQQEKIDSIKNLIIQFSIENKILVSTDVNQAITESFISLLNKDEAEEIFKIAQEESATVFVLQKELEQRIINQNQLIKERDKILSEIIVEKEFGQILSTPDVEIAKDFPNRERIIFISIILSMFISCGFFITFELIKTKISFIHNIC